PRGQAVRALRARRRQLHPHAGRPGPGPGPGEGAGRAARRSDRRRQRGDGTGRHLHDHAAAREGGRGREPGSAMTEILAVDDTPANLTALGALLTRPDVNVVAAASGAGALALLHEREFAVVVLDAQMPILDGFEVARRIRRSES